MTGVILAPQDTTATGKNLANEVIFYPPGTILTDGSGNQTTVGSAGIYLFREHIIAADPTNPLGVATVTNAAGPNINDFGLTARLPAGQPDLQTIVALLLDIDTNIAALAGNAPLTFAFPPSQPQFAIPTVGSLPPPQVSPTVPRAVIGDKFGRQIVLPHTIRELCTPTNLTITASTSETTLIAAGPSDTFNDIVAIVAANTSATATRLDIRDTTGGTTVIPIYLPAGDTRGFSLGGVIIPQTKAGQNWTAQCSVSVTDVRIWALSIANK